MTRKSQQERDAFYKSLRSAIETVCRAHGVSFGSLDGWVSEEGLILLSIGAHEVDFDKFSAKSYVENAEAIGLSPDWINTSVKNPETSRTLKVVGLFVDGGDKCVMVEGESGERYRLSPSELSRLMIGA